MRTEPVARLTASRFSDTTSPPETAGGTAFVLTETGPAEPENPGRDDSRSPASDAGAYAPTALRMLVTERHWQKFTTFERQFRNAARELAEREHDPDLAKITVSPRQFERWYSGKVKTRPHPDACRILEFMFGLPVSRLLALAGQSSGLTGRVLDPGDAARLTAWLTGSTVSDEAIAGLDRTAARIAESHALTAPAAVLASARQVQASVQGLLRAGRMRHRQERELLRINGNLLAHISLLHSDLSDDTLGEEYGNTSMAYLREAGASEAAAWYVLAKIARWRHRYADAANLARAGLDHCSLDPMRVQLACYEANAAALAGDPARAGSAMRIAEDTATALPPGQMTLSPWSFPDERLTMFGISLAIGAGEPDRALQAAAAWRTTTAACGRPHVTASSAQIHIGASIARLQAGELDGAADEVGPVLALPPQFRIATITGWLYDLRRRLCTDRYAGSPIAAGLDEQIRLFTADTARHRAGTSAPN